MAVRCGAGQGKSGAPLARGCFLLLVLLLLLLLDEACALTARQPDITLGSLSVKFRGGRSALMHPTATSFSPPNKRRQQPSQHLRGGSSSSSFMPPGVVSRAPSTRSQVPSPAAPAITPAPHTPRTHTWPSGAGSRPLQPTVIGFGLDQPTAQRSAKWNRPQASHKLTEGGGGWAGMNTPAVQGRWLSAQQPQHTPDPPDAASPFGRQDTFGVAISEDLSHLDDRTSGWRQRMVNKGPVGGGDRAGTRETTRTVFTGGSLQPHLWSIEEEVKEEGEVADEDGRSLFDFNATSEYQPDDYSAYHEYDHSNTSWHPPEQTPSPINSQGGNTDDDLRTLPHSEPRKVKDVLELVNPKTPFTPNINTTMAITLPALSHPPNEPDVSAVDNDYQGDVTRHTSLPATETESEDDNADLESKERSRKKKKKGRRGKGGRRRTKKGRKGKKGQKNVDESLSPQADNTTQSPAPDPWVPSTPRELSETTFTTITIDTRGILLPTTQPPTPDSSITSPSSIRSSEASIVSATMVEAPSDPKPGAPGQTTFVEGTIPSRRQNSHTIPNIWEERNPRKTLRPARPSPEPEQTITETEEVNFVREKQRDDYVFPLRGLLIISGLMGALAVFTLVVLISYAVIKCSKKPVVNNYQVSEQQKPAGT